MIRISFIPVMLTSKDPTYVIAPPFYWSVIESNIGVLAASIPSFKPLAKRFLPRIIGESSSSRNRRYGGSGNTKPPYKSGNSDGFSKLESEDPIKMKGFNRDVSTTTSKSATNSKPPSQTNDLKESTVFATVSHGGAHYGDRHGPEDCRDSDSSEDFILAPGRTGIVRTIEVTTAVEDKPNYHDGRKKADFYPGSAV